MSQITKVGAGQPAEAIGEEMILRFQSPEDVRSELDQQVRQGVQQMLQPTIEAEVEAFLEGNRP